MVQFGGDDYRFLCLEVVLFLVKVIKCVNFKIKKNVIVIENCILVIGKILKFKFNCVNVDEVFLYWLLWFLLYEDKEEVIQILNFFCDLIESNYLVVIGLNNFNFFKIISIIVEGKINEIISYEDFCVKRLVNVVRQIQIFEELWLECIF